MPEQFERQKTTTLQQGDFVMISQPGDNRTALIAALIAIPAAAVITMAVHTFVPSGNSSAQPAPAAVPQETAGHHGMRAPRGEFKKGEFKKGGFPKGKFNKENFKKRFMEARKKRMENLEKIVSLCKKRVDLLTRGKGCPKELLAAQSDYILAQSAVYCQAARIRLNGTPVSEFAVKVVEAQKAAELDKAYAKKKPGTAAENTAIKSEITAMQLQMKLDSNRITRDPAWKKAFESYKKAPGIEPLKAMLNAERDATPAQAPSQGFRRHHK